MTLPQSARIGRHLYNIVWHEENFTSSDNSFLVVGECLRDCTEIHVSKGQSLSQMKDTLFHECLHAVGYEIGAREFSDLVQDGFDLEEYMVSRFTPVLLNFMAENAMLIKWVTSA